MSFADQESEDMGKPHNSTNNSQSHKDEEDKKPVGGDKDPQVHTSPAVDPKPRSPRQQRGPISRQDKTREKKHKEKQDSPSPHNERRKALELSTDTSNH